MTEKDGEEIIEELKAEKHRIGSMHFEDVTLTVKGDAQEKIKGLGSVSISDDIDYKEAKAKFSGVDVSTQRELKDKFSMGTDVVRELVIEEELSEPCESCGNDRMFHDKRRRVFCPVCEDL